MTFHSRFKNGQILEFRKSKALAIIRKVDEIYIVKNLQSLLIWPTLHIFIIHLFISNLFLINVVFYWDSITKSTDMFAVEPLVRRLRSAIRFFKWKENPIEILC